MQPGTADRRRAHGDDGRAAEGVVRIVGLVPFLSHGPSYRSRSCPSLGSDEACVGHSFRRAVAKRWRGGIAGATPRRDVHVRTRSALTGRCPRRWSSSALVFAHLCRLFASRSQERVDLLKGLRVLREERREAPGRNRNFEQRADLAPEARAVPAAVSCKASTRRPKSALLLKHDVREISSRTRPTRVHQWDRTAMLREGGRSSRRSRAS